MINPKYKKTQLVNTPYGVGEIQDLYTHAFDPDSEPSVWMYQVSLKQTTGLKVAVFQESELYEF